MIIPVKCWNCSASKQLLIFWYSSELSVVKSCYSQHSAQMSNKIITAIYLQNNSSISPEWSFKWNTGFVLFISYPNSTMPVFHWTDDNSKFSFALAPRLHTKQYQDDWSRHFQQIEYNFFVIVCLGEPHTVMVKPLWHDCFRKTVWYME